MDSKQIDPEHAKLFEQMFGAESKGQNVDIMDPKLKTKLNEMTEVTRNIIDNVKKNPDNLPIVKKFFNHYLTFFYS